MGKCQKIILFVLILNVVASHNAWAKKAQKNAEEHNSSASIEDLLSSKANADEIHSLQKYLPYSEVGDAKEFWQGIRAIEDHDVQAAQKHLQAVRTGSWFSDYSLYFLAKTFNDDQKFSEAYKVLQKTNISSKFIQRQIGWDLFWLKMDVLANLQQGATLRNELKTLTPAQLKDRFVYIEKEFVLGKADLLAKDQAQAISHFTNILVRNPGSDADERIFALAKEHHLSEERLLSTPLLNLRAENLINIGLADWGYEIYQKLNNTGGEYLERQALALFRGRRYVEACPLFEALLDQGSADMGRLQVMVRLSQCYTRTDQQDKAIAIHQKIMREFPGSGNASSAPFSIAQLLFDAKRFDEAIKAFSVYLPDATGSIAVPSSAKQRQQSRWFVFWSYYLQHKWDEAISAGEVALAEVKNDADLRKAYLYFLARSYDQKGEEKFARQYYEQLLRSDGTDYYELLAKQRLKYKSLYPFRLIHPDLAEVVPQLGSDHLQDLKPSLFKKHDNLGRAFVLNKLSLASYAYDELQTIDAATKSDAEVIQALSVLGNSRMSYVVGVSAKGGRVAGCSLECVYFLRYPQAYKSDVETFTTHWKSSRNLAFAIMRQESAFAPTVVSPAYAYGLMQIIAPTGQEIASEIGYHDFHPHDLLQPKINILFGTRYLKSLSNQFSGDLVPTIASYNAGPYNNKRWLARGMHQDWDEYVELIPYAETKNYVKRVLVNFWIYERLYP